MAIFDRFSIRVVAVGAGLFGIALALSPGVALAGGSECLETSAGDPAAAAAAGCAPITGMSGVPMALPGPVPALAPVVPLAPPVPVVPLAPPVPVVPPLAPPVPVANAVPLAPVAPLVPPVLAGAPVAGLPLSAMGGLAGKGDSTGAAPSGAPMPGEPILPGPGASGGH